MATKKTAIRPDFFANFESLKRNKEAERAGGTPEEQALYSMSLTEGWKLFNNTADKLMDELQTINDSAVANGAPYEELGKNTVVISIAKGILRRLINFVEDAKEACERPVTGGA